MNNFLFARLGDNDFGSSLKYAIDVCIWHGADNNTSIELWKDILVSVMTTTRKLSYLIRESEATNKEYFARTNTCEVDFQKMLAVEYLNNPPDVDHNHASIVYDFHLKESFFV